MMTVTWQKQILKSAMQNDAVLELSLSVNERNLYEIFLLLNHDIFV